MYRYKGGGILNISELGEVSVLGIQNSADSAGAVKKISKFNRLQNWGGGAGYIQNEVEKGQNFLYFSWFFFIK